MFQNSPLRQSRWRTYAIPAAWGTLWAPGSRRHNEIVPRSVERGFGRRLRARFNVGPLSRGLTRIFGEQGKENGRKSRWWHTGMQQLRGSFTTARAAEFLLLQCSRLLSSLFLFLPLSLSHGVAVQVTSITALNARRVPTSTSFCSPRDHCEIYLDSNIAAEMSAYCRAQLLRYRSISANLQKGARAFNRQLLLASEKPTNVLSRYSSY